MRKSRYSDSQIMALLKQAEAGTPVPALCREHGRGGLLRTSFDRHRSKVGLGPTQGGPTIHDMRKTCATYTVILQYQYPTLIPDRVLIDLFGWTEKALVKMKRIYVSDAAVIDAMTSKN